VITGVEFDTGSVGAL
jgi:hypothetical protein